MEKEKSLGRETNSGILSGGPLPTPPWPEDTRGGQIGGAFILSSFPGPRPVPRLEVVSKCGTFVWQPLSHPHQVYLFRGAARSAFPTALSWGGLLFGYPDFKASGPT